MTTGSSRRNFLKLAGGVALASASKGATAQQPRIKIGLLTAKTGVSATTSKEIEYGITTFLDERKRVLAGRQIEFIVADSAFQPAQAMTKTRELIERDNIDILIGPLGSAEALAVNDYVNQAGIPHFLTAGTAEDLTQRKASPWLVRTSGSGAQFSHPLADYAAKDLKYKRIATIADDGAYGYEAMGGFQRAFEDAGGKIVQKLWPPFNAVDYATYMAQLNPKLDALMVGFIGQNSPKFLRQWMDFGFKTKTPLLASVSMTTESLLRGMGDEAVGIIGAGPYTSTLDTPANKKFLAGYLKANGQDPDYYSCCAYTAGLVIEEALKAVNGNISDKAAFMKAVYAVKLTNDLRGNFSFDQYGNAVEDVHIFRATKMADGKLRNVVVKTYPAVSQFWTYDPAAFLKDPVYSRDFPPAKNLE